MATTADPGLARDRARARRFAIEIAGACLALALFFQWRGTHPVASRALAVAAVVLLGVALLRPAVVAPIASAWLGVGERIARVTTPVFLTVIYLAVLTPLGVVRRRVTRSPIRRDPHASTHWVRRDQMDAAAARAAMEHQF
jgi:hypothetical protein